MDNIISLPSFADCAAAVAGNSTNAEMHEAAVMAMAAKPDCILVKRAMLLSPANVDFGHVAATRHTDHRTLHDFLDLLLRARCLCGDGNGHLRGHAAALEA
jgi:hypothetical protein